LRTTGGLFEAAEFWWQEDKLFFTRGKSTKPRLLENAVRPHADEDVLVCVLGFEPDQPLLIATLDADQAKVHAGELRCKGQFEFTRGDAKFAVDGFESSLLGGCTFYVRERIVEHVDFEKQPVTLARSADRAQLRKLVAANPALLAAFLTKARAGWKLSSNSLVNKELGLSLAMRKGWTHQVPGEDAQVLSMSNGAGDSAWVVFAEHLGTAYELPEYAELVAQLVRQNPKLRGEVASKKARFGGIDAVRHEFQTRVAEVDYVSSTTVIIHAGIGFQFSQVVAEQNAKELQQDQAAIARSVRFEKR
jgi:hypothetical protein